jgi:hypothetical protein
MKYKTPINNNYCAVVVEIKTLVPIENCDNVVHAIIMGNHVVVSKNVKVGDVGLYFPLETRLSNEYLSINNLYRKPELNADKNEKGYFEENGRIRCVKFRGNKSEGLFMPIDSIAEFLKKGDVPVIGDEFDELNGVNICSKYVVKISKQSGNKQKNGRSPKVSKLVDGQFNFHQDTAMLYKNMHKIQPESLISITYKMHGTSGVSSNIICKKQLKWYEKLLLKLGVNVVDTEYDNIYSSRNVVKNEDLNPNANHYYKEDIWGIANNELKEFLQKGMTFYYEIVGYLPSGGAIQGTFDYGCKPREHAIYIYRITYTNADGKVFEYTAKQVQDFCKMNGLKAVPQLYYGYARDLYDGNVTEGRISNVNPEEWRATLLEVIKDRFNEKDCFMCINKVPEEGCVIRLEDLWLEAFKCKSERFCEFETKELDKGISNIEDEN